MADNNVVRHDVVQVEFDVMDSELVSMMKSMQEMTKSIKRMADEMKDSEDEAKKNRTALQKMADSAKELKSKLQPAIDKIDNGLKKVGKSAISAGKKIASGLGGAAKKAAKGAAVLGTGFASLVGLSVNAYGDYEQLVGGVETLFKDSKDEVVKYANDAYKAAGMSANDYMETVTGFSASMLQSLGGDTKKAAKLSNQAIIDMSDNANKMGTDMGSIQYAYQGFAKQNYTMLDNLKLGYGGTKSEMERLLKDAQKISGQKYDLSSFADITEAIHVIQEDMGIAGTTSKEASETIQGSFNAMKSAAQNFITGMADPTQDFDQLVGNLIDSVVTFGKNIIPRIIKTIPRLFGGIVELAKTAAPYIKQLVKGIGAKIVEYGPIIAQKIRELISQAKDWLIQNKGVIWEGLKTVVAYALSMLGTLFTGNTFDVEGIKSSIQGVFDSIMTVVGPVFEFIKEHFDTIIEIVKIAATTFGILYGAIKLFSVGVSIINGISTAIGVLTSPITWVIVGIVALVAVIVALVRNWDKVKEAAGNCWNAIKSAFGAAGEWFNTTVIQPVKNFFSGLWNGIKTGAQSLWTGICTVFSTIAGWIHTNVIQPVVGFFNGLGTALLVVVLGIVGLVCQGFLKIAGWVNANVIQPIKGFFVGLWNSIKPIVAGVKNTFVSVWSTISGWVNARVITPVVTFFTTMRNRIKSVISSVKNAIVSVWASISGWVSSNVVQPIINLFKNLWSKLKAVVSNIKTAIVDAFQAAWDKVTGVWSGLKDFFNGIWEGIRSTGETLKNVFVDIFKKAVEGVAKPVNKLIDGANWVLDKVGSDKKFDKWQPYAKGTKGHPGGNAIVNDGRGAELVQLPNGKSFIPAGRNVLLPNAPKGMKVLDAERTASLMGRSSPTFNYEEGSGGWIDDIFNFFDNAKGLVGKVIEKFVSYDGLGSYAVSVGKGIVSTAKDAMVEWVKGLFDKFGGKSLEGYEPSKGVNQWKSTVANALKLEGVYNDANVKRTLYQMQTESGGNPRAINLWDSNAKKGTPSKGLMQVIDPTFKSYARKGYSSNIYDPMSNILASVRYANSRYGSLAKAYRGVGYASGIGFEPRYAPGSTVSSANTTNNSSTNNYSPQFTLNMSGTVDRTTERTVKRWVQEAINETLESMARKSPRLTEV